MRQSFSRHGLRPSYEMTVPAADAAAPGITTLPLDRRRPGRVEYGDPHLIAMLRGEPPADTTQAPVDVGPVAIVLDIVSDQGQRPVGVGGGAHTLDNNRIDKLYAWVPAAVDGNEGVTVEPIAGIRWSLIGTDRANVEACRWIAEVVHEGTGRPVRLMVFSNATVLEEIV